MFEYQKLTKEKTIRRIFRECLKQGESTALSLCKSLSLSKPTVNDTLIYLESENLIISNGYLEGEIGRKPQKWIVNKAPWLTLAISIDVSIIRLALVNVYGEIEHLYTTGDIASEKDFINFLYKLIKTYLSSIPKKYKQEIKSCSISIAGNVSFDRKTIVYATNMNIENLSILPLEKKIKMPVFLENDANCGALLEFHLSKNTTKTLLYISIFDKGVGGGYIVDGRLQKGANRRGGEIGHFTIDFNGRKCSCGNKGCFECYASNIALLELLAKNGFKYNNLDEVFADDSNDEIIKEYCYYLGLGIRGLYAILDPHQIIIGGQLAKYKNRIEGYIEKEVFFDNHFITEKIDICYSKYNELSSLIGAGLLPFFPIIYEEDMYS